jgi:hypothetical protein
MQPAEQGSSSNSDSYKQLAKKLWDNCTFENTRNAFSFITNFTAIGSATAPLLPKPIKQVIPPVLGGISYTSLQAVYRADNDKLRSKVARHKRQYEILQRLLPARLRNNAQYKAVAEEVNLEQYGVNPYAKGTAAATWVNIVLALAASGLAGYMAYEGLDDWNSDKAIGLGVTALALFLTPSVTGVVEEHQKKVNLEKIDTAYKSKITAMKTYLFENRKYNKLESYHTQSQAIPKTLKLTA